MITDGNKRHYLDVSNLCALLEGKLPNHHGDFYCLNCFDSYTTENKLKEREEICNNHDSYYKLKEMIPLTRENFQRARSMPYT